MDVERDSDLEDLASSSLIKKFLVEEAQPRKQARGKRLRISYQPLGGSRNPNRPQSAHDRLLDNCVTLPEHDDRGKSVSKATIFYKGTEKEIADPKRKSFHVPVGFAVQQTEEEAAAAQTKQRGRNRPWSASSRKSQQSESGDQRPNNPRLRPSSAPRTRLAIPLNDRMQPGVTVTPGRIRPASARVKTMPRPQLEKRASFASTTSVSSFRDIRLDDREREPPQRPIIYGPTIDTGRVRTRPDFRAPAKPQVHVRCEGVCLSRSMDVPVSPQRLHSASRELHHTTHSGRPPLVVRRNDTDRERRSHVLFERDSIHVVKSDMLDGVVELPPQRYGWDEPEQDPHYREDSMPSQRTRRPSANMTTEEAYIRSSRSLCESSARVSYNGTVGHSSRVASKKTVPVGFHSHLEERYGSKTYAISTFGARTSSPRRHRGSQERLQELLPYNNIQIRVP